MRTSDLAQRFARNLDLIRHARGLSTRAFADVAGISRHHLSMWRRGKTSATLDTVATVAERLGVNPLATLAESQSEVLKTED